MPLPDDKAHWRIIAAAAAISAMLAVLATLLTLGYLRQKDLQQAAEKESIRATEAAAEARAAANRRVRARDQAEELVSFLLDDLRDELIQINRSDLLGASAGKAVIYFDQLPPDLVTPESRARLASVLLTLSDSHYQQGNEQAAIAAASRSIEIWKQLASGADPDGKYFVRWGRALGELGLLQNQSNDPYAATQTYREMLRLYGNPPPRLKNDGWQDHGMAKACLGLGEIERLKKSYAEARIEYTKAISHITKALTHDSNEISWLQMVMTLHNNTGVTFMHDKSYAEADESFQRSMEPNRRLIVLEPKNRRWEKELASTLLNVGALHHLQKDYTRAEPYIRESLALRQGIVNWDPKSTRATRKLAHAWHRMALLQFDTGKNMEALASARGALKTCRRLLDMDPDDTEAIDDTRQYSEKYSERLSEAGMRSEAIELIQQTTTFAEANRSDKTGSRQWEKLMTSLRNSTAALKRK